MKTSSMTTLLWAALLGLVGCSPADTPATVGAVTGRLHQAASTTPIAGATVRTSAGSTATTNEQGWFVLADLAPAERLVVRVLATGFAEAIEPVTVRAGAITNVDLGLLPVGATRRFQVSAGGTVDDGAGASAVFPPNALVSASGQAVTGEVEATITALDTDNAALLRAFPGDYSARRTDGTATLLETVVPMALTVRQGTQELNLATGTTAAVTFPVPAGLASSAPATIGLWSLDPATGAWREEGTATRAASTSAPGGAVYRATISHLSWWNCDRPLTETTCLRGCLRASDGQPTPNARVLAMGVDYRGESTDTSGSDGCFAVDVKLGSRVSLVASATALVSTPLEVTAPSTAMNVAGGRERCMDVGTITLDPPLAQVILEWGERPSDLDSHFTGPQSNGRFHVYYGARGSLSSEPYCELDTDDTSSFGPEITTLTRATSGRYRFSVRNYSGQSAGTLEQSGARVLLLIPRQGLVRRFEVPTSNGGNGDVWRVFDLVANGNSRFDVVSLQSFASDSDGYDP